MSGKVFAHCVTNVNRKLGMVRGLSIWSRNTGQRMRMFLRYIKQDALLGMRAALGTGDTYSWKRFHREVRTAGCHLLRRLDEFPDAVLVSGCQRSGTTILARIITQSDGMVAYSTRRDDELDAALILSGTEEHVPRGRYCFQTTYLNECYREYFNTNFSYKLVWVLRNPFSVVYSMKYNWSRFAFNELFESCGYAQLDEDGKQRYSRFGRMGVPRTERACFAYNGKQLQALDIKRILGDERMIIIDYDEMVRKKEAVLPLIYQFIDLPYSGAYARKINDSSIRKSAGLSHRDKAIVERLSLPVYEKVREFVIRV